MVRQAFSRCFDCALIPASPDSRSAQHDKGKGFTKKYKVHRLVYYESHQYVLNAIQREKQLKGWRREKKIALI